jgi:hypothetical protein
MGFLEIRQMAMAIKKLKSASSLSDSDIKQVYNPEFVSNIELWLNTIRESKDYNLVIPIQNLSINALKITNNIKYFPFHRAILMLLIKLNEYAPRQNTL